MAKRLVRDTQNAVLGGVAAGFGQYLDVDPVLARLVFVLLVFANGFGLLAYLVCWLVMPRREAAEPAGGASFRLAAEAGAAAESVRAATPDAAQAQVMVGSLLVVGGAVLLTHNLGWLHWPHWMRFATLWPLLLVVLGLGLILKSRR